MCNWIQEIRWSEWGSESGQSNISTDDNWIQEICWTEWVSELGQSNITTEVY